MSNPLPQTIARFIVSADLEDSTTLVAKVGDLRWQEISRDHNLLVRRLISQFGGEEFGRTDGFLVLFERASDSLRFSLSYHEALQRFALEGGVPLGVRVGIHLGEVVIHETTAEEQSVGARSREVDGLGVNISARLMGLARGGQTLLTRGVYDLAQRGVVGDPEYAEGVEWLAHGPYLFQGMEEPVEVFEAGRRGYAPLNPPSDSGKARRVLRPGEEEMLGWRPVPGASVPQRKRWILERKLGEGGFGEAWLARYTKTREPRVFKFCFDPERLRGLKREVTLFRVLKETLGKRDDIAPILEWNFDGAPYFIESDYTDGGDLKDWAESTAAKDAPVELRLRLVAEIASAVGAAHSVGVIHKDIKPSNVLIYSGQDGQPHARLTDFGIGLILDRALLGVAGVTETGLTDASILANHSSRTGTRLYTAPELIEGKPPTIQSDIYAIGVVLYQLVVGDVSRSLTGDWREDITDDLLREDVAACVAGEPARRLTSAEELATRLRDLEARRADRDARRREQEQIEVTRRALESAKARRKVLSLASVVATMVIAALSLLYFQAERQRNRAEQEKGRAEAAAKEASEQRAVAKTNEEKALTQQKAAEAARDASDQLLAISSVQLANSWLKENRSDLAKEALAKAPMRYRNWDWGYARFLANPELVTLRGHQSEVWSAAFSPDGTRIVTASGDFDSSTDNTARVWDAATGAALGILQGHTQPVCSAVFSPDGTRILTVSSDDTARVWNAATGEPVATLQGRNHPVRVAQFSPDGTRIVTAPRGFYSLRNLEMGGRRGPYTTACIWDAATGVPVAKLQGHTDWVNSVEFSRDGTSIVTTSDDGTVRIWDVATGAGILTFGGETPLERVLEADFSPERKRIVTTGTGNPRVWDSATGVPIATLQGHTGQVHALSFSPDGSRIATASEDKTSRVWDATTGATMATLQGHKDRISSLRFSPDGTRIATVSDDGTALLCEAGTGIPVATLQGHTVGSLRFSPDGTRIVTGSDNNTVRVWDATTGAPVSVLQGHADKVRSINFSPDGTRIITASDDKSARLWDAITTGVPHAIIHGVREPKFSPEGARIIASLYNKEASEFSGARVWDTTTLAPVATLQELGLREAVFSPDGARIVTCAFTGTRYQAASSDKFARVWNTNTGALITSLNGGYDSGISFVAFSPDSTRIATGGDNIVHLWDAATATRVVTIDCDCMNVSSVAFSPDSTRIAICSIDSTLRVWDATNGAPLVELRGHEDDVVSAEFSPDGTRILTTSLDHTARVWNALTGALVTRSRGSSAAFSADGSRIVVAVDNTAQVRETATGALIATLDGHMDSVRTAMFSRDGTRVLTTSEDNTARVWDATTGSPVTTLQGHTNRVTSAAFSPDGNRILTDSEDGTARVWEAAPWREVPGSPNSDGLPIEGQFRLWKLKRYRDWQLRRIQEKPDSALGGKTREDRSREIIQQFKDAYPDWAKWF